MVIKRSLTELIDTDRLSFILFGLIRAERFIARAMKSFLRKINFLTIPRAEYTGKSVRDSTSYQ